MVEEDETKEDGGELREPGTAKELVKELVKVKQGQGSGELGTARIYERALSRRTG